MRGARGEREAIAASGTGAVHALEVTARSAGVDPAEEALVLLREIRDTLRARRERGEAAP
jgi:hypothetical protein